MVTMPVQKLKPISPKVKWTFYVSSKLVHSGKVDGELEESVVKHKAANRKDM